MSRDVQLTASASVTLNGAGGGQVSMGPTQYGEVWTIVGSAVTVSTNVNEPQARIYLNTVSPAAMVLGTYSGSFDTSSGDTIVLQAGQTIICVWTDGDALATATYAVNGTRTLPG